MPPSFQGFLTTLADTYATEIGAETPRLEVERIKRAKYTDVIRELRLDFYTLTIIAFDIFKVQTFDPLRMPMQDLTFGTLYEFAVLGTPYP